METRSYFGCRISQRLDSESPKLFIFHARSKDIREWAGIKRVSEVSQGTQRILRKTRRRAVTSYLEADSINTIPNSILIAFNPGTTKFVPLDEKVTACIADSGGEIDIDIYNKSGEQSEWGLLKFSFNNEDKEHEKFALIVDGQHRMYGLQDYPDEDIPVVIVALLDATPQEQAFQFIVINKKSVRVDTDDAKSIIADFNVDELSNRLSKVRINYGDSPPLLKYMNESDKSPFKNLLDWSLTRTPEEESILVPVTAIEQSFKYIRTIFSQLGEDDDSLVEFFCTVWNVVKKTYEDLWAKNSSFMTKVNITTLNEFLVDGLKSAWSLDVLTDIFELDRVEEQVLSMLRKMPSNYWIAKWPPIKDNANYRAALRGDLENMSDNAKMGRNWHDGLSIPEL
jgi:DGQHR domain-containing protein